MIAVIFEVEPREGRRQAYLDIAAALKLKPGDGAALVESGLLRRQLGDVGGARRDFQAALKSSAAAEAKAYLELNP